MVNIHGYLYIDIKPIHIYIDVTNDLEYAYFTKYYKYTRSRENALKTLEAICKDENW